MKLVIIEPVSSGVTYVHAAKKLGIEPYVFSIDGGEQELGPEICAKLEHLFKIDTHDFELQKRTLDELSAIGAVLPGVEYAVPMAARLGASQGKPHLHEDAVEYVRNKFNFRKRLNEVGLSDINFFLIEATRSPIKVPQSFAFPAVVKPVDMAGSICVRKVNDLLELTAAIEDFGKSLPSDVGFKASGQLIVETYIPGKEYSVEGIVRRDGSITIVSITEKLLGAEPYFIEIGHIVGQYYDDTFRKNLTRYALSVLDAIQLNIGPFHLELRVTPAGQPIAIELAARLPGDHIVELIEHAHGINLAIETVCEYLGLPSPNKSQPNGVSAIAFIPGSEKTSFKGLNGLDPLIANPHYLSHHVYLQPGDDLGTQQDWSSRIGHITFGGTNVAVVESLVRRVHNEVEII